MRSASAAPTPANDSWLQKPRSFTGCVLTARPVSASHESARTPTDVLTASTVAPPTDRLVESV